MSKAPVSWGHESLRASLTPASLEELDRRGYREVKVLSRDSVHRLVSETAARLFEEHTRRRERLLEERHERELATERARLADERQAEVDRHLLALEHAELGRAEAERRAESLRMERDAAEEDAAAAHRAREAALQQAAEAEEAFTGARHAAARAEHALAAARRDFEAQVAAILADPLGFAPGRAPPEQSPERKEPPALELVFRRSLGFGLAGATREPERAFGAGRARAPGGAAGESEPGPAAPRESAALDVSRLEARLSAIEAKLDLALEARAPAEVDGVASRFGPGTRAGLRPTDPQWKEKRAILRRLIEENVRLRGCPGAVRPGGRS